MDTNVGMGMVPCKPNCRCKDCAIGRLCKEIDGLKAAIAEQAAEIERLRAIEKASQILAGNAEFDGDISAVDTLDLRALVLVLSRTTGG